MKVIRRIKVRIRKLKEKQRVLLPDQTPVTLDYLNYSKLATTASEIIESYQGRSGMGYCPNSELYERAEQCRKTIADWDQSIRSGKVPNHYQPLVDVWREDIDRISTLGLHGRLLADALKRSPPAIRAVRTWEEAA